MKYILSIALALAAAFPAHARITNPDGNGDVIVAYKQPAKDMIAACAKAGNWFEATCDDAAVALGVCTSEQAANGDAYPTVTCTQGRVDNFLCAGNDLGREIPSPSSCKLLLDDWIKRKLEALAQNGYKTIRDQATPTPTSPGDVTDDQ